MASQKKHQIDWYMEVYQIVSGTAMETIPPKDTELNPRAKRQLESANEHMLKMLDALANIITLVEDPDVDDSALL